MEEAGPHVPQHWLCPLCCRLGFTYLRLKDNYMEILNRENGIER